jgi:microcystin-dependent protein
MKSIISKFIMLSLIATQFASPVLAGIEPFLGEIQLVGFDFCPRGFLRADGQLIPIDSNTALFSLLGTQFGGDGRASFALPDLRGRVPLHAGAGYNIGETGGSPMATLTVANLPAHHHTYNFVAKAGRGVQSSATGAFIAESGIFRDTGTNVNLATQITNSAGGSQAFSTMPPYLGLTYCIATQGIYPSRN